MAEKIINFDMDGTFVDLYGVDGWLDDLINSRTRPYEVAKPMINMSAFARRLNYLQKIGYIINVISWTAKNGSTDFNERVKTAKLNWLAKHLKSVKFNNVYIVPYGTPKHEISSGILFDDEKPNRDKWGVGAYDVNDILGVLKAVA
jgi:hypothetical protein